MSEWDNYCEEIGGVCKDMEAQDARIAKLEAERDSLREALKEVLPIINVINPRTIDSLDLSKLSEKIFQVVKE